MDYPIEQQIAELKAAGWIAKRNTIWKSPTGKLFIGPHGAWKKMREEALDCGKAHEPGKPCPKDK